MFFFQGEEWVSAPVDRSYELPAAPANNQQVKMTNSCIQLFNNHTVMNFWQKNIQFREDYMQSYIKLNVLIANLSYKI